MESEDLRKKLLWLLGRGGVEATIFKAKGTSRETTNSSVYKMDSIEE